MIIEDMDRAVIWEKADAFRASVALNGHNVPPIDMMYVVDVLLQFDVIEIDNMANDLHMEAAIVPLERALYIDRGALDSWERKKNWVERRLRFTLAHEIGHYVLHETFLSELTFSDVTDFKRWMLAHRNNKKLEDQANEFAGRFLVPIEILREEYDRYSAKMAMADPEWHLVTGMRERLAERIATRFDVNRQVIETRFDHEGLWLLE